MELSTHSKLVIMNEAVHKAQSTMRTGIGGPFGAAIVKDGNIITIASNSVLADNDPTAHAEINAIRSACKLLNTPDLSECEIYTTAEPCPMCLSAIMWANIKKVYYGCTQYDADYLGFRDARMYSFIRNYGGDADELKLIPFAREECIALFQEYKKNQGQRY